MKILDTTTKIIVFVDLSIALILNAIVVYGVFWGAVDMTPLTILAGLWDGQLGLVIGFYLWKSKNENRSKHAMSLVRELADKHGIEAVTQLAEIILKD